MEKSTLPRKSEKSVKIGNEVTSDTPKIRGAIREDMLGNSRETPTPQRSLSRVHLPPPSRGCHGALGPWPMVPMAPTGMDRLAKVTRAAHLGSHGTQRGPWHPPIGGGKYSRESKFVVNLLVNLLIILEFTNSQE